MPGEVDMATGGAGAGALVSTPIGEGITIPIMGREGITVPIMGGTTRTAVIPLTTPMGIIIPPIGAIIIGNAESDNSPQRRGERQDGPGFSAVN
ncbi:hypothetical protein SBDP1_1170016 [Syntrophobacter sp. SbD1]|nr:hypothetical protein SBDP1_1170016 [Syntrophobacter sp. SbD1]